ncbi:AMP-binding protein [Candidatus Vondammii sp. HM_W22]|uniref:AMP-binding protein n=1 Tax=Candidatus Vondammii sp. HM_W22 TaxID=2687299 RepID=UPI002E7C08F3|nr:AMP-binding protein [Candidatus Vondammii sp. HM_W22]
MSEILSRQKFNKTIYEGYGTAETTPVASVNIPDRLDTREWRVQKGHRAGTVGLPLPGSSFCVVDPETLKSLPAGEDGLILAGGTQVMLGYLKDPKKWGGHYRAGWQALVQDRRQGAPG